MANEGGVIILVFQMTKLRLREVTCPRSQSKEVRETEVESNLSGSKDAGNRVGTPKCHLAASLLLSLPRGSPTQQGVIDNDTLHPTQMQHQLESGYSELPTPTPKPESSLWTDTPRDQRTGRTQLSIFSSSPDSRYMQLRRKEAQMRNQKKKKKL